ncbi:unnamed protein product [Didymodactylos carnosus]|uniref:Uncharacterized protein n=1 Tax=Didymodactylos carnosus TaxID=1234261 RepID=A0A815PC30_9BILA|nr:unnamed protein product [Didymodactylos carnosus]CAF4321612.1 unnamed protein product [Didymodactylos carnosus]
MIHCGDCTTKCNTKYKTCISGTCVGYANASIRLSWNIGGDGDLLVTTPNNVTIWKNNSGPSNMTDFGQWVYVNAKRETVVFNTTTYYRPSNGTYYICFQTSNFSMYNSTTLKRSVTATVLVQSPFQAAQTNTKLFTNKTTLFEDCNELYDSFLYKFTGYFY